MICKGHKISEPVFDKKTDSIIFLDLHKIFIMKFPALYLLSACILFFSCCTDKRLNIDVSGVTIPDVTINRLEQDLFKMDTNDIQQSTKLLQAKYGHFYSTYITGIINNGNLRDSSYAFRVKQFIADPDMKAAYADCQRTFPSTDTIKQQFTELFKHFRYYFPKRNLPKVVTMMSGFNSSVVVVDSTLSIGLEMYLGNDNKFYQMLAFPHYKTMFMNKENIITDIARSWMMEEFPYTMNQSDFLSEIIYYGKIMYLTDALLPNVQDTLKIKYTKRQLDYCTQNEFNIWSYFAAQKMLYTTDQAEIMKFTAEGPFTTAFSKDAPPRIGYWTGWQIVRQYMKKNPTVTLEELMKENNAQMILSKSKYKPGK